MQTENMNEKNQKNSPNYKNFKKYPIADRTEGFTQLDNRVIRGEIGNLSSDAKVALMVFLSLPDNWTVHIPWFNNACNLTKGRSQKAREELESKGFLETEKIFVNGRKGFKYTVYELPQNMMFKKQELENKPKKIGDRKQEIETMPNINKENKKIDINKDYKESGTNTCITEGYAKGQTNSLISKERSIDSECNNSIAEESNINACSNSSKNIAEISNIDITSVDYLHSKLDAAEKRLDDIDKRKTNRERNEKAVIDYINSSLDIPDKIKGELKNHIKMRSEKGIRTTITMFQQLYSDLKEECKTIDEQIKRIQYAISCGYPTFRKKSCKKVDKSRKKSIFVKPQEDFSDDGEFISIKDLFRKEK